MVATRTAYWAEKRPNWTKTAPAILDKPLKRIRKASLVEKVNEDGTTTSYISPTFYMALDFARIGDGYSVNLIARSMGA